MIFIINITYFIAENNQKWLLHPNELLYLVSTLEFSTFQLFKSSKYVFMYNVINFVPEHYKQIL